MKVTVNGKFIHQIDVQPDQIKLDGEVVALDSRLIGKHKFSIIHQNRSFNVEFTEENRAEKTCVIKVNGTMYTIQIEDQYDQLLKQLGLDISQSSKVLDIKAPMPGLVLKVLVEQGQQVVKGDNLLVLEAMKMENMIKSPTDGVINLILVNTGDKVEKNGVMIQFS